MYTGGQPLSELATGSMILLLLVDSSSQITDKIRSSTDQTADVIGEVKNQTIYNTVLFMSQSTEGVILEDNEILHPPNNAGATVLPDISVSSLLPPFGMMLWQTGGYQTVEMERNKSSTRSWRTGTLPKSYWPMVQGPIFVHRLPRDQLSTDMPFDILQDAPGVTLNFWMQPLRVNQSDEGTLFLYR